MLRKLIKLKRWLSLPEAAQYLSLAFGEAVSEADILRLALDRELTLSVYFVNATKALCGKTIPLADASRRVIPTLDGEGFLTLLDGIAIPGERMIKFEDRVRTLNDVWDLTMWGAEEHAVEDLYQTLTGGPACEMCSLEGAFVTDGAGTYCKLMSRFDERQLGRKYSFIQPYDHEHNYYPAASLPDDSVLVVRTSALQALEARMAAMDEPAEKQAEKPVERRERTTLLVMIAALAEIAKVDIKHPSKAAAAIESQTAMMGARVAARTIEGHLNRIGEALESRA